MCRFVCLLIILSQAFAFLSGICYAFVFHAVCWHGADVPSRKAKYVLKNQGRAGYVALGKALGFAHQYYKTKKERKKIETKDSL